MIPSMGGNPVVRQADLPALQRAYRLLGHPVVARVPRAQLGGGFGDQARHPNAWGVFVQIDGLMTRIISARGLPREWTSLDRLERWLREQGFRNWWVQNELEPVGEPADDDDSSLGEA
jgi:hypothetical protein